LLFGFIIVAQLQKREINYLIIFLCLIALSYSNVYGIFIAISFWVYVFSEEIQKGRFSFRFVSLSLFYCCAMIGLFILLRPEGHHFFTHHTAGAEKFFQFIPKGLSGDLQCFYPSSQDPNKLFEYKCAGLYSSLP
jgi:hypothetical protein